MWSLFNKSLPAISKDHALTIAKNENEMRGWTWQEPIKIELTLFNWYIYTNAEKKGANSWFYINRNDGRVIKAGRIPR